MRRCDTPLPGVFEIRLDPIEDERGFFARTWCEDTASEWAQTPTKLLQESLSYNARRGTLRGLHFQVAPYQETKVVQCLKGALMDVVVDCRPDSPTFGQWTSVILSGKDLNLLWIPKGCAHGFQTLEDDTLMMYRMDTPYMPQYAQGIRWDDPDLAIAWPVEEKILSERDLAMPSFAQCQAQAGVLA